MTVAPVDGIADFEDFTPTITGSSSSPTLTAASYGRYQQTGKHVVGHIHAYISAKGSGYYTLNLPVTPLEGLTQVIGTAVLLDASADTLVKLATPILIAGLGVVLLIDGAAVDTGAAVVGDAVPWTFASGDEIALNFCYEAD